MTKTKIILHWLSLITIILLLVSICSCSRSASWHIGKAQEKDPSLFSDTLRSISSKDLLPVTIETPELNDCVKKDITWTLPREWTYKGDTVRDTIAVTLKAPLNHQDSLDIHSALEVDCDPVIIKEELPPIVLEPKLRDMIIYSLIGLFVGVFISSILILKRR